MSECSFSREWHNNVFFFLAHSSFLSENTPLLGSYHIRDFLEEASLNPVKMTYGFKNTGHNSRICVFRVGQCSCQVPTASLAVFKMLSDIKHSTPLRTVQDLTTTPWPFGIKQYIVFMEIISLVFYHVVHLNLNVWKKWMLFSLWLVCPFFKDLFLPAIMMRCFGTCFACHSTPRLMVVPHL